MLLQLLHLVVHSKISPPLLLLKFNKLLLVLPLLVMSPSKVTLLVISNWPVWNNSTVTCMLTMPPKPSLLMLQLYNWFLVNWNSTVTPSCPVLTWLNWPLLVLWTWMLCQLWKILVWLLVWLLLNPLLFPIPVCLHCLVLMFTNCKLLTLTTMVTLIPLILV